MDLPVMTRSDLLQTVISGLGFILSLFVAIMLFAWGQPRRDKFVLRLCLTFAVTVGTCALIDSLIYFFVRQDNTMWFQIAKFVCGLVMSCASVAICFKVDIWAVLYFGVISYCVQHLSTRVFDIFQNFCLPDLFWLWRFFISIAYYAAIYVLLWRFYIGKSFRESTVVIQGRMQLVLAVCVIGISIVYNTLGITYATGMIIALERAGADVGIAYDMLVFVYIMTSLVALLALALSVTANGKLYYSEESQMLDKLLSDRRARYEQDKMNVELLNMRLHDLKHYIGSLDEKTFKQQKDAILDNIGQYDTGFNSGNDALDTLFTNKSVQCKSKGIRFYTMLGGAELGSMPKFELYAVFCNAIDNAIEASEHLPEEKRVISITAQRDAGGKTVVTVENYFDGVIRMQNNMPLSDKKSELHGVGVKSIKMLMEKYGGGIDINVYDEIFSLRLIFP